MDISSIILILVLASIMLGMGLSLTLADFRRVLIYPKGILTGLVNQLIFLPILGLAIANFLNLSPEIAVGIMLLAACPGGTSSNIITYLAKGDSALSVSLTAVSSVISIFTIPLIVSFAISNFMAANQQIEVDKVLMVGQLLVIVIIPVGIGMSIRAFKPNFATLMDKHVRRISTIMLILITAALVYKDRASVVPYFQQAGIAALLLNFISLSLGFLTAELLRLNRAQSICVAIESGIQNSGLAITLAVVSLQNVSFSIAPGVYTLIMYCSGFWLSFLVKRFIKQKVAVNYYKASISILIQSHR